MRTTKEDILKSHKTAVLVFEYFSNYEISIALSVMGQCGRIFDVFCKNEYAKSEEGLTIKRTKPLDECNVDEYDSLLIPGCMDLRDIIDDEQIRRFLQQFDLPHMVIASISSSPLLLYKAGILEGKKYIAGLVKEELLEEGFTMEELSGMRDITELKNEDGTIDTYMVDGKLLTGIGGGFREFGIEFGKLLNLNFEPQWYGI
jgi:putative intracellular protease/amidase